MNYNSWSKRFDSLRMHNVCRLCIVDYISWECTNTEIILTGSPSDECDERRVDSCFLAGRRRSLRKMELSRPYCLEMESFHHPRVKILGSAA